MNYLHNIEPSPKNYMKSVGIEKQYGKEISLGFEINCQFKQQRKFIPNSKIGFNSGKTYLIYATVIVKIIANYQLPLKHIFKLLIKVLAEWL